MALSLPGERTVAAASQKSVVQVFAAWFTRHKAARARRLALRGLLEMDAHQLRDLGISHADIADAATAGNGRTPGMVLNAARARSSRA